MTRALAKTKARVPPRARAPTVLRKAPEPALRLQTALRVGAVNDPAEHEADRMADRVVRDAGPTLHDVQAQPAAIARATDDQPALDQLDPGSVPADQAAFDVPQSQDVPTEALDSGDVEELETGKTDDPPADAAAPLRRDASEAVVGRAGGRAPADVAQAVAQPGPGRPLPIHVRARLEPHFGTRFDKVRLHDTAADQRTAARIGARAFAHENHIWLGRGERVDDTRLISHELTHVVQQTKGSGMLPRLPVLRRFPGEDWLEGKARHIPGYTLMTVLVGRKLISGDRVRMTAENLLGGLMGLLPGGTLIYDRLKEARVIQDVFAWVRTRLHELNLTGARVRNVLSRIPGDLSLTSPFESLKRIFGPLVRDLLTFVGEIKDKVLEFIIRGALKLAGPYADKIWGVLEKARDTIKLILSDPLAFAKNLVKAIVGGFGRFATNIITHLKRGLLGWLFGSLQNAGIELPAKLDFKGLMSIALQVLGLTYASFRKQLVRKLGPKGERMVALLEKSVEVVKILLKAGFVGIWQKLLTLIDNFRQTVIGGITEMVISTVIRAGLGWLAGLSNPAGAIVKVVLAIYDMIVAFLERLDQIIEVAKSIFSSIGSIARGQVAKAAEFIEKAIGGTVPVVISFLAAVLGLGGITKKIRDVIRRLQKPVKKAMGKLLTFLKKKAKKLFSKLLGKLNRKRKLPAKSFMIGTEKHTVFAEKKGKTVDTYVASTKKTEPEDKAAAHKDDKARTKEIGGKQGADAALTIDEINAALEWSQTQTDKSEKGILLESERASMRKKLKALGQKVEESAERIQKSASKVPSNDALSEKTKDGLVRAVHRRPNDVEGAFGLYGRVKDKVSARKIDGGRVSDTFEIDHTIEKRFSKAILENLAALDPSKTDRKAEDVKGGKENRADRAAKKQAEDRKTDPKARANKKTAHRLKGEGPPFGKIGAGKYAKIDANATEFPAVVVYKPNHIASKGDVDHLDMLKRAAAEKDPQAYIRNALTSQFNREQALMTAKLDADPDANQRHKADLKKALKNVKEINAQIFDLDRRQMKVRKDKKREADMKKPGETKLLFTGTPNFSDQEGLGGHFGHLASHKWFERDHIVDQSYPKNLKALPLLQEGEPDRIAEAVKDQTGEDSLTADQDKRLSMLKGQKLYPPGGPMGSYTEGKGHAVILYSVIAKRVNSRLSDGLKGGAFAGYVKSDGTEDLVSFVKDHGVSKVKTARKKRAADLDRIVEDRETKHSLVVAEEYQGETEKVASAQQLPKARAEARKEMTRIVARLHSALAKARTETGKLTLN
jgi:hypothetical protein